MANCEDETERIEEERFQEERELMMREIERLKLEQQNNQDRATQRKNEKQILLDEIERLKRQQHEEIQESTVGYTTFTGAQPDGLSLRGNAKGNSRGAQAGSSADLYHEIEVLKNRVKELEKGHKVYPEVPFLNYKDRKRILISGGAGFVGSHLVDKLMMQGHEVNVVDNFFTGRKKNVEHWIGHPNFELIHADIVNSLFIEVNQIYHLASPASPPNYMYNPMKTLKTNTVGTLNMLGLAKRCRARLLLASTSEVYGDPEVHPQTEEYWGNVNPIGPRACYDEGKRVAETMCYASQKQDHLEVRVARIFNTFGPRMHMNDGRVVSNFILQALQGEPITIYGKGDQTRSFQYVSDLVDGLEALMNSNFSQPVNIGNPDEYTISDFADIIKKMVGGNSKIVNKPSMQDDPRKRKPDITRAKKELNWQPKIKVMDGINRTIEYFRQELKESHMIP